MLELASSTTVGMTRTSKMKMEMEIWDRVAVTMPSTRLPSLGQKREPSLRSSAGSVASVQMITTAMAMAMRMRMRMRMRLKAGKIQQQDLVLFKADVAAVAAEGEMEGEKEGEKGEGKEGEKERGKGEGG